IKNSAGQITHFLSVQEDSTRLKETAAKLAQARDRALEASRLKTRLLANVSHDLRTPLNAILGYTEMLQEGVYGPLSDSQRAAASEIIDSTGQLLNFVNNLLDQSRIESGRVTLNLVPFAPADLLADVQAVSGVLAAARGLELRSDIASGVPKTIAGDPYWLRQIVVNLVSNAIKFTDEGSAHIHIFRSRPGQWGIQVSDTGCGIPPEAQTRIFDPFWQVNGTATRGHAGSGLGLSIVKQLTAMMGGEITVRSQVGGGSTFTLLLPLQTVEEAIV
ncbi:MAG: sensor histidine kinase, partial [Anaerolineae bacterium]